MTAVVNNGYIRRTVGGVVNSSNTSPYPTAGTSSSVLFDKLPYFLHPKKHDNFYSSTTLKVSGNSNYTFTLTTFQVVRVKVV